MDETSLMSYCVIENITGNSLMIFQADGDGKTIWKWMHEVARENNCNVIQCLTNRAKALERKWGFKPIATYMELEVEWLGVVKSILGGGSSGTKSSSESKIDMKTTNK